MIGRFSQLNIYRELWRSRDIYRILIAAVFAGGSGMLTPIMGALVHNIGSVLVVLSSASLAFVREST